MNQYIAFLRGMNVGGHRLKNPELCAHFEAMGFSDVSAFLASGNVIFVAKEPDAAEIEARIESGLLAALGYAVPTFLRTAAEVRAIARCEPFSAAWLEGGGKLQVAMLASAPSPAATLKALALSSEDDRLAIVGRELHWLPRGGISQSELDLSTLEKNLGSMTVRTRKTLERLAARLDA